MLDEDKLSVPFRSHTHKSLYPRLSPAIRGNPRSLTCFPASRSASLRTTLHRRLAQFQVGARAALRIVAVVDQRAVDETLVGVRIDAQRIAGPDHGVGILARLERADLRFE